ncbi:MAG: vitamin B12 dependent-methionine synthase activation domain-containing protein [Spirochaetia bacterium]|jgi:hypothetical protein|nr:vitamin B12 dependent-methionine synthase activation domain-containing protein [Spirochaetia bacterium]
MLRYINNITIRTNYSTIFSALGYKRKSTELSDSFKKEITGWINDAAEAIKLDAVTIRCGISLPEKGSVELFPEDNPAKTFRLESASLHKFLSGSSKAQVMGITAGSVITELIDNCQRENMTKAVVLDAAAGEIVDNGLDYIISLLNRELVRESGKLLSKRFSPGYGDLALESQGKFFTLLEMERLGVKLTESFMLLPQKSVIAITGIVY